MVYTDITTTVSPPLTKGNIHLQKGIEQKNLAWMIRVLFLFPLPEIHSIFATKVFWVGFLPPMIAPCQVCLRLRCDWFAWHRQRRGARGGARSRGAVSPPEKHLTLEGQADGSRFFWIIFEYIGSWCSLSVEIMLVTKLETKLKI